MIRYLQHVGQSKTILSYCRSPKVCFKLQTLELRMTEAKGRSDSKVLHGVGGSSDFIVGYGSVCHARDK